MRLVFHHLAGRDRRRLDEHPVVALFHGEHAGGVLAVAFRSLAGDHAVFPGVPRTHHELAVQPALRERTALVVAAVGYRAERAFMVEHGNIMPVQLHGEWGAGEQVFFGAEAMPGAHAGSGIGRVANVTFAFPPGTRASME